MFRASGSFFSESTRNSLALPEATLPQTQTWIYWIGVRAQSLTEQLRLEPRLSLTHLVNVHVFRVLPSSQRNQGLGDNHDVEPSKPAQGRDGRKRREVRTRLNHLCVRWWTKTRPDGRPIGDCGQADCHPSVLVPIVMEHGWLDRQQVRSCSDGHLLLEPTGAASTAHEHEGVFRVRLQPRDQLPLQAARDLQALLVVEDLKASGMWVIRKLMLKPQSGVKTESRLENLNGA